MTPINHAFNPDDPKWTAYVLGELDESERAAVELELESLEDARTLVDELQFAVNMMKMELRAEPAVVLTPEQREKVHASAGVLRPRQWFGARPVVWVAGLAAAAGIVLAVSLSPAFNSRGGLNPVNSTASAGHATPGEGMAPSSSEAMTQSAAVLPETTLGPVPGKKLAKNDPAAEFGYRYAHPEPPASSQEAPTPTQISAATGALVAAANSAATDAKDTAKREAGQPAPTPPPPAPLAQGAAPAIAVGARGQIGGVVQDASNAMIPGVTVVATNSASGVARSTLTDESGAYSFTNLEAGEYRVAAAMPGFKTSVYDNIQLAMNTTPRLNFRMEVGAASSRVEVSVSASQLLNQSSASVGEVLPENRIRELPLVGNNILDLTSVLPGFRGQGQGQQGTVNVTRDGLSFSQGQQGQGQGQGQGQQGQAGGDGKRAELAGQIQMSAALSVVPSLASTGELRYTPPPAPARPFPDDRQPITPNTAVYDPIIDNPFLAVNRNPLSTFSADVDTASYSNVRRFLNQFQLPPQNAVRIEEMINYFNYDYPQPSDGHPIGATMEVGAAPWNPQHRLVRIGIKARDLEAGRRLPSNLVFLIDVSGSMTPQERLPLLKNGLAMLVEQLSPNDRVTVVTYAGTTSIALPTTLGNQKDVILRAIDGLQAGGSTNGASGIQLAYDQAIRNFIPGGVNRVILATDGDFNVGITNRNDLLGLVEDRAKSGVFLSVLGVGTDNYKDSVIETLADKGNGNYAYLDTLNEARKVLVDQMHGTLVTVAKDVKLQIEFNPAVVGAYRLIGYENRALRNEDFNNDLKDAGDMGAGHTVTALYEVVPRGVSINVPGVDPLRYQVPPVTPPAVATSGGVSSETLAVKIRYKDPNGGESKLLQFPLVDSKRSFSQTSKDFHFAAAVASFGMILRDSPFKGTSSFDAVKGMAEDGLGEDRSGYRREFMQLIERARQIRR